MDGLELGRPMEGKPRDLSDKTQPVCLGYIHWIYTGKPRDLDSGKSRDLSDKTQPVCFGYIHRIYTEKPGDLDAGKSRDLSDKSQWKKP